MRNRRELAAASSDSRMSRIIVSAEAGNFWARDCRSKVDVCFGMSIILLPFSLRIPRTHYHRAMHVLSAAEMQACDRATTERFSVPSIVLMRNASTAVAVVVRQQFPYARRVTVL